MKHFAAYALLLSVVGCTLVESTVPEDFRHLRVDRAVYAVNHERVDIHLQFTNVTNRTVYIGRCGPEAPDLFLQKEQEGEWIDVHLGWCPLIGLQPIKLRVGQSYEYKLRADAKRSGLESGTYRVGLEVFRSWDDSNFRGRKPLPIEERMSEPFTIQAESH